MNTFDPKKLRIDAGLKQAEVAALWGVSQSTLSRWEENPSAMKKYQRDLYLSLEPKVEAAK